MDDFSALRNRGNVDLPYEWIGQARKLGKKRRFYEYIEAFLVFRTSG